MKSLKLALVLFACVGSTAFGQITVSGDFSNGTGQLAIQQDLTFTITNAVSGNNGYWLVFEGMNGGQDASQTQMLTSQDTWQRSINGGAYSAVTASSGYFRFYDRLGGTGNLGAVTGNDTFLLLTNNNTSYSYAAATTVTMQAITFTFQNTSANFDPDAIGSFTGNVFLADAYSGARLSANIAISAVPEPSTYALCGGIAALGLALWSRRRRVAG